MGFFSALKSVGSWLVGSSGNGMDVVKGVGSWIDEQQWTEQEQAEWTTKRVELFSKFLDQTIKENSERSRTRRSLSLLFIRWWLLMMTFSGLLYPINQQWSKYIWQIVSYEYVVYFALGIGAFFWGAHIVRGTKFAKED